METFDPIPLYLNQSQPDLQNGGPCHLTQTFDLDPIGAVCLRFFLHIDSAPEGTIVTLNRWRAAINAGQPFVADVTDYVTLDDNVLVLEGSQPGSYGAIWLERIPCEELI